jgi:predicted nucleic acid-binding protein
VIILDTNVISALMRPIPDRAVIAWLDDQEPDSIWTTAVTVFEVELGIALLAEGRRRRRLEQDFVRTLREDLQDRVLPFDLASAHAAAALAADRERTGRPVDVRDTQIAGIAVSRRATIATRNVRHFSDLDVPLINPWST